MENLHVHYELILKNVIIILSFTQAFATALFIVTLQHSNISKLISVYVFYCTYTPSNGAVLNKISMFRIPYSLSVVVHK